MWTPVYTLFSLEYDMLRIKQMDYAPFIFINDTKREVAYVIKSTDKHLPGNPGDCSGEALGSDALPEPRDSQTGSSSEG